LVKPSEVSRLDDTALTTAPETEASVRRAPWRRVLEVLVSLLFLALALRGVSLAQLWSALRTADYLWLAPGIIITVILLVLKAWRWQLLFYPEYRLPFSSVFTALCAGYLASNVFPARLGEVVRMFLLAGEQPVSVARTLSTIVIERLLDLLTLFVMLVALLPFVSVQLPVDVMRGAAVVGVLAVVGSAALVILSVYKAWLLRLAHAVLGRVRLLDRPPVYAALEHLIDGFAALRGRLGLFLVLLSLLGWAGVVGMAGSAALAMRLNAPLTALVFAVVLTTLGMLVPSSPGYIGVFHYLVTVALLPFGVPKDTALGFALVWHGVNYLTLCASGVIALWVHGTSLSQILKWRGRAAA
jgi:glycosyltransferase 2 family protein